jgi:hypothetical protein
MADSESADAKAAEPVQSIEVEPATKNEGEADAKEDGAADENAEEDAEADEDDAQGEEGDGRPVSRDQYKALKSITDTLTNHKIQVKNESVESIE